MKRVRAAVFLGAFIHRVNSASVMLSSLAILLMTLAVTYEVVMRYFFIRPTIWSVEIASYLVVMIVFLSAGHTLEEDGHIRVDFVVSRLSAKARHWLSFVTSVLALGYCAVLLWETWDQAWSAYSHHWRSMTLLRVYLFPIYLLMPLGCLLLCVTYAAKLSHFRSRHGEGSSGSQDGKDSA